MTLGIRAKLLAGFGAVLALAAIVGATGVFSLRNVNDLSGSMYADRVVPIRDMAQVRALLGDIDSMIQRAITDDDGQNKARSLAATADRLKRTVARFKLSADTDKVVPLRRAA
jgi:hypothetical protein